MIPNITLDDRDVLVVLVILVTADCLAGVYLELIPNITLDDRDICEIATFAYRIGDYAWGHEHHHGTPKQRVQAVVIGMKGSLNGKNINSCHM
ncbi:hypothetical protein [Rivularia sp. UHCC 0363]|uniref:hypothetical protein n=1 Tax=Rivularia sp. UHCC 0363 TaxID=3110244 RepID=UPI002B1EBC9D|nr:hypothetical protein [Rivularia sp. UHCC 0363]MEA5596626.1 hypothetical protein [Rivularia sp. UHCC 0363]